MGSEGTAPHIDDLGTR